MTPHRGVDVPGAYEDVLPHHLDDRPDPEPPLSLGFLWRSLLVGAAGLVIYQVLLIAVAAPLSGWAPLTSGTVGSAPANLEALLMWALVLPYLLTAFALTRGLPGATPRSIAGFSLAAALWAAPFYYPQSLTPAYGLDSFLGVAYHLSPAVWGGLAGGILGDAARRRPGSRGLWVAWETIAPVLASFFLLVLIHDSPATRPVLGPALFLACLLCGVLAGLASRGRSHGLVAGLGAALVVLLQRPLCLGLAFGPVWGGAADWFLPVLPLAGALLAIYAYRRLPARPAAD